MQHALQQLLRCFGQFLLAIPSRSAPMFWGWTVSSMRRSLVGVRFGGGIPIPRSRCEGRNGTYLPPTSLPVLGKCQRAASGRRTRCSRTEGAYSLWTNYKFTEGPLVGLDSVVDWLSQMGLYPSRRHRQIAGLSKMAIRNGTYLPVTKRCSGIRLAPSVLMLKTRTTCSSSGHGEMPTSAGVSYFQSS